MTKGKKVVSGDLMQYLQLQAVTLTVKALVETHPNQQVLTVAMRDLFAQLQTTPLFLRLPEEARETARRIFAGLLPLPPP